MNTQSFTFSKDDVTYTFLDTEGSSTVPYVWNELLNDVYGLETIKLSKDDIVIDIGGNVGMFSIYVKKKFGCKIIAFEPIPQNFENFKKNILLNGFTEEDFELHQVAITSVENDTIYIATPPTNSGGSSRFEVSNVVTKCTTETIDKYLTNGCTYLKIDCEGGEYEIIPTILDKLNNFKFIGIEYHSYNHTQDALDLNRKMVANFNGPIFSNILDKNASWNINRR
jgi:FkbM family methyltransferase